MLVVFFPLNLAAHRIDARQAHEIADGSTIQGICSTSHDQETMYRCPTKTQPSPNCGTWCAFRGRTRLAPVPRAQEPQHGAGHRGGGVDGALPVDHAPTPRARSTSGRRSWPKSATNWPTCCATRWPWPTNWTSTSRPRCATRWSRTSRSTPPPSTAAATARKTTVSWTAVNGNPSHKESVMTSILRACSRSASSCSPRRVPYRPGSSPPTRTHATNRGPRPLTVPRRPVTRKDYVDLVRPLAAGFEAGPDRGQYGPRHALPPWPCSPWKAIRSWPTGIEEDAAALRRLGPRNASQKRAACSRWKARRCARSTSASSARRNLMTPDDERLGPRTAADPAAVPVRLAARRRPVARLAPPQPVPGHQPRAGGDVLPGRTGRREVAGLRRRRSGATGGTSATSGINDTGYFYSSFGNILRAAELLGRTEVFTDPQARQTVRPDHGRRSRPTAPACRTAPAADTTPSPAPGSSPWNWPPATRATAAIAGWPTG